MKTIRQIADEIGVSKTAVNKQIANLGLRSGLRKNGNQFAIDEHQETLIKQAFSEKSQTEIENQSQTKTQTENHEVGDLVCVLQATIDTLQGQLEVKDRQIAKLTEALVAAQQTAAAAQALHAGTMKQGKQIDTVVIMNDGTIEKDGYFWKTSKDNIELSVFDELVTKHSSELPLEWDKIPMVMVDGKLYYDTGKESTVSARCGVMDGEITSTVDGSEIPTKDNQSNFGTGFEYQYGADNTIEIFMNEKWIVFEQREGTGNQVQFGDRMVDADGLSEETLEWLDWYNSLPEEQQLAISAVPPDLLEESGLVKTEDAEVSAQEDELCGYPLAPEEVE